MQKYALKITMLLDYFNEHFAVLPNGKTAVRKTVIFEEWQVIERSERSITIGQYPSFLLEGSDEIN